MKAVAGQPSLVRNPHASTQFFIDRAKLSLCFGFIIIFVRWYLTGPEKVRWL